MSKKENKSMSSPVTIVRKRIGETRGERLTQAKLAEEIGVSEKYISMLENGRPLNRNLALKILRIAPQGTRLEWLLGEDDFETERDKFNFECNQARLQSERDKILEDELLKKIALRAGFTIEREGNNDERFIPGYCFVDERGKKTVLDFFGKDGVQELWYDFFDYAAFRLKRTIERKVTHQISWTISHSDKEGGDDGER